MDRWMDEGEGMDGRKEGGGRDDGRKFKATTGI